jgi:hypothetical protein
MPKITVIKDFKFAERGLFVTEYAAGETYEVSDECAEVALAEKWATGEKTRRAAAKAPEVAAEVTAPEVK